MSSFSDAFVTGLANHVNARYDEARADEREVHKMVREEMAQARLLKEKYKYEARQKQDEEETRVNNTREALKLWNPDMDPNKVEAYSRGGVGMKDLLDIENRKAEHADDQYWKQKNYGLAAQRNNILSKKLSGSGDGVIGKPESFTMKRDVTTGTYTKEDGTTGKITFHGGESGTGVPVKGKDGNYYYQTTVDNNGTPTTVHISQGETVKRGDMMVDNTAQQRGEAQKIKFSGERIIKESQELEKQLDDDAVATGKGRSVVVQVPEVSRQISDLYSKVKEGAGKISIKVGDKVLTPKDSGYEKAVENQLNELQGAANKLGKMTPAEQKSVYFGVKLQLHAIDVANLMGSANTEGGKNSVYQYKTAGELLNTGRSRERIKQDLYGTRAWAQGVVQEKNDFLAAQPKGLVTFDDDPTTPGIQQNGATVTPQQAPTQGTAPQAQSNIAPRKDSGQTQGSQPGAPQGTVQQKPKVRIQNNGLIDPKTTIIVGSPALDGKRFEELNDEQQQIILEDRRRQIYLEELQNQSQQGE